MTLLLNIGLVLMNNAADCWQVLEIEPTEDRVVIKKAYAALLKKYHPEEFPDKFIQIREAYSDALSGYCMPQMSQVTFEGSETEEYEQYEEAYDDEYAEEEIELNEQYVLYDGLYSQFITLIESDEHRPDIDCWNPLFEHDLLWNLDCKTTISHRLFQYLAERLDEVPLFKNSIDKHIWFTLDDVFDWQTFELLPMYGGDYYENIFNTLRIARGEEESLESLVENARLDSTENSGFSLRGIPVLLIIAFLFLIAKSCHKRSMNDIYPDVSQRKAYRSVIEKKYPKLYKSQKELQEKDVFENFDP